MVSGTVKWFNARKGYGFLTPDGAGDGEGSDIFVHFSNIQMEGFKALYENDKVEFEVADGDKGKEAKNVTVLERAPRQPRRRRSDRADDASEEASEEASEDASEEASEDASEDAPADEE